MLTPVEQRLHGRSLIPESLFDRLVRAIQNDHEVTRVLAERILDQALVFLGACASEPEDLLVPSSLVDIGWHTFILYTKDYAAFCDQVAGRFIHHVPDDSPDAPERIGKPADERARTLDAIDRAGYLVDPDLWMFSSAKCGNCHEEGNCAASGEDGNENSGTRKKK
jgi:hypothetical protein